MYAITCYWGQRSTQNPGGEPWVRCPAFCSQQCTGGWNAGDSHIHVFAVSATGDSSMHRAKPGRYKSGAQEVAIHPVLSIHPNKTKNHYIWQYRTKKWVIKRKIPQHGLSDHGPTSIDDKMAAAAQTSPPNKALLFDLLVGQLVRYQQLLGNMLFLCCALLSHHCWPFPKARKWSNSKHATRPSV